MSAYCTAKTSISVTLALGAAVVAQETKPKPSILITNARASDGGYETLATGISVLVKANEIARRRKA